MEKYLYQDLYNLEETHWWHRAKRQLVTECVKRYAPKIFQKKKIKLLDVGCGTGKSLEAFQSFAQTFGVDVSKEALRFCRARGLKNIKQADATGKLPFPKSTFDVITLLDVLEHVDEKPTLREVHRVVRPDGVVIIAVPAFMWLWSTWDTVLHHKRRYTVQTLRDTLRKNGFQEIKISYLYAFLLLPMLIIRRLKTKMSSQQEYGSDFQLSSPLINILCGQLSRIDRWLYWHTGLPFGTSIVVTARKGRDG